MNTYKENIKFEDGILKVHLSGEFPKEILGKQINLFQPLIDAASKHNCMKALIDIRELQIQLGTMDLFKAAEDALVLTNSGIRLSLLAREDSIDVFFENVSVNRGSQVGVFKETKAALEWLQK